MQLFGFTLNLLTLFALVLAIGVVVDDAIVVVEAVHSKMERTGLPAKEATIESMKEISGAIISITLVMAAVFVPVGFMQGPSGVFYRQFAFTLATAILISAVNALTLSPALSALFLKNIHPAAGHHRVRKSFANRFFAGFNKGFNKINERYGRTIRFFARYKWIPLSALLIISLITYWMMSQTPTGFIPAEDQGFVVYNVTLPAGSSLERTKAVTYKVEQLLKKMEPVETFFSVTGFNLFSSSNSSNYAVGFVRLKSYNSRGSQKKLQDVMQLMNGRFSVIKEANIITFTFPTVPGFGNIEGFEMILQDRANGPLDKLGITTDNFIAELMKREEIAMAFSTYYTGNPQYLLQINEIKAKQLGISVTDILQTLQLYYGSALASDFNRFGKYYRVIVQADIEYRANPATLNGIYIKNNYGQMVPANTLVSLQKVYGPETVTRNNLFNSVTINGMPKTGYSSGDAINAVQEVADQTLPRGYSYEWTGMSKEEISSGGQAAIIFLLCLVFVYFLLCAQYESYILPLAVILSIPFGIFGVFLFIKLFGIDNNIYVQVGLIMLIGLLSKNAILIVEYAVQRRKAGMSLLDASLEASTIRLRPILMTSFAFIVGILPLTWATGSSAMGNRSISTGAVGGMLFGVLLGVLVIPVLFIIFQFLQEKITPLPPCTSPDAKGKLGNANV
jgi:HAE1 family hydrophobic/amphiphilic exporter-1